MRPTRGRETEGTEPMTEVWIQGVDAITLDDEGRVLRGVDLLIEGGRISRIGQAPPDTQADEVIDGRGKVALPGLFNAHSHAAMTFERGWVEDLPFPRWLNEKIGWRERPDADDVYGARRWRLRNDPPRHGRLQRSLLLYGPRRGGGRAEGDAGATCEVRLRDRRGEGSRAGAGGHADLSRSGRARRTAARTCLGPIRRSLPAEFLRASRRSPPARPAGASARRRVAGGGRDLLARHGQTPSSSFRRWVS